MKEQLGELGFEAYVDDFVDGDQWNPAELGQLVQFCGAMGLGEAGHNWAEVAKAVTGLAGPAERRNSRRGGLGAC